MKIRYIVYLLLLIGIGSLIFYRISENKKLAAQGGPGSKGGSGGGKGGPGGMPAMQVNGVVLQTREFASNLAVTGTIEANEQVEIRGEISGIVKNISFQEGSTVTKGQVLVRIDDAELRAQLAQANTRQKLTAENERRAKLLLEKEAISHEEYDVAKAELQTAQTQLMQAQLSKTIIKAPFSGRIGLRNISTGGFLTPDLVIANLLSVNPVKITFSVPEKYMNQVKVNTELLFSVAGTSEKYKASVYAIEPGIDASSRTLQLRARANNPDGSLRPGSFANIELPLSKIKDALLVPSEAIVPIQNGKKVFITRNGKATEVKIETGTRTENEVLVTSGVAPGDTVLTTGIMTLKAGSAVKVKIGNSQPKTQTNI